MTDDGLCGCVAYSIHKHGINAEGIATIDGPPHQRGAPGCAYDEDLCTCPAGPHRGGFASPGCSWAPTPDPDYEPANDAEDVRDAVRAGLIEHDDVHCKHGTFIGTPGGPDYLCGRCESGEDDAMPPTLPAARIDDLLEAICAFEMTDGHDYDHCSDKACDICSGTGLAPEAEDTLRWARGVLDYISETLIPFSHTHNPK